MPHLRPATRADLPRIHAIRQGTPENVLTDPSRVTDAEVAWYMDEAIFLVSEDGTDLEAVVDFGSVRDDLLRSDRQERCAARSGLLASAATPSVGSQQATFGRMERSTGRRRAGLQAIHSVLPHAPCRCCDPCDHGHSQSPQQPLGDGGRVRGFACANHQTGLVWALFVDEDARGRGHGTALLDAALARLARIGHRQAFLTTDAETRAAGFYRARGWRPMGVDRTGDTVFLRAL